MPLLVCAALAPTLAGADERRTANITTSRRMNSGKAIRAKLMSGLPSTGTVHLRPLNCVRSCISRNLSMMKDLISMDCLPEVTGNLFHRKSRADLNFIYRQEVR